MNKKKVVVVPLQKEEIEKNIPGMVKQHVEECVPCVTFINPGIFDGMSEKYGGSPESYSNKLSTARMYGCNVVSVKDTFDIGFSEAPENCIGNILETTFAAENHTIPESELFNLHRMARSSVDYSITVFGDSLSMKLCTCIFNNIYDIIFDLALKCTDFLKIDNIAAQNIVKDVLYKYGDFRTEYYIVNRKISDFIYQFSNLNVMPDNSESGLNIVREYGIEYIRSSIFSLHADILNRTFFTILNAFRYTVYTSDLFARYNPSSNVFSKYDPSTIIINIQNNLAENYIPCLSDILKSELSKIMNIIVEMSIALPGGNQTDVDSRTYDFEKSDEYELNSKLFKGNKDIKALNNGNIRHRYSSYDDEFYEE